MEPTAMNAAPLPGSTVADILTRHPQARDVFARLDIDYCCVGDRTVAEVCRDNGLDVAPILVQLSAVGRHDTDQPRWDQAPLPYLIRHIVEHCHRPLQTDLPLLLARTRQLVATEEGHAPAALTRIVLLLEALLSEMGPHMEDEEAHLFPWLKTHARHPDRPTPALPRRIRLLMDEHEHAVGLLRQLRVVTHDYSVPVGKDEKWAVVYQGLADLDAMLLQHIHLENNVLFPRVRRDLAA